MINKKEKNIKINLYSYVKMLKQNQIKRFKI